MVMTVERTHSTSGNLALAADAGVAAGFAANLIRKAVMQAPTALSGNWSDALAAEHQMTLASFAKLVKTTPKQTTSRTTLLMHIKHSLAKNAFQEETVVYPPLRDPGSAQAADHLTSENEYEHKYPFDLPMIP